MKRLLDKKKRIEVLNEMIEVTYERYVEVMTNDGYENYISQKESFNKNTDKLRKELEILTL